MTTSAESDSRYLRHDEGSLLHIAVEMVAAAERRGLAAVARISESAGLTVTARDGAVETRTGDQSQRLMVTVHDGLRQGHAGTGRFDANSMAMVLDRAAALAKFAGEDAERALPPADMLAEARCDVPLFRSSGWGADTLAGDAIAIEAAARVAGNDDNVIVDGAGAQSHDHRIAMAMSGGFAACYSGSTNARWCSVAAGADGDRRMASRSSVQRDWSRLRAPDAISADAVARATAQLGPRTIGSRPAPVLFENRVAGELVGALVGALSGGAQMNASSFLPDALGRSIAASHLMLHEDPFLPFGDASAPFDGEGIAGTQRDVLANGVATGYFLDMRASRRMGMPSTGNANGAYNLRFTSTLTDAGDDLPAMLRKLGTGLFVTGVSGQGVNPVTGDYSRAASGFWVKDGAIAFPVDELMIVGNLKSMLEGIVAVGADVPDDGQTRTGSVLIDRLDIAAR